MTNMVNRMLTAGHQQSVAPAAPATSYAVFITHANSPGISAYNSSDWSSRTFTNSPGQTCNCVDVSPDETDVCFGWDNSPHFRFANVSDGTTIQDAASATQDVDACAFNPAGTDAAISEFLGWSELVAISDGSEDSSFPNILAGVTDVHWHSTGKWCIYSGNTAGSPLRGAHLCTISDPDTVGYSLNTVYRPFNPGSAGYVLQASAIRPDDAHYAAGLNTSTDRLQVWVMPTDPSSGDATTVSTKAYSTTVRALAYSPDSAKLAVGFVADITHNSETTRIAMLDTSDYSTELAGPVITETLVEKCFKFSPDGSLFAVGITTTPFLRVYDTSDWSLVSGTPTLAGTPTDIAWATL